MRHGAKDSIQTDSHVVSFASTREFAAATAKDGLANEYYAIFSLESNTAIGRPGVTTQLGIATITSSSSGGQDTQS